MCKIREDVSEIPKVQLLDHHMVLHKHHSNQNRQEDHLDHNYIFLQVFLGENLQDHQFFLMLAYHNAW
jgi:hypothetical protein